MLCVCLCASPLPLCSTIEESYRKQTLVDETASMVEIVDTAGQEEFAGLREQWLRYGEGFILVFSVTSRTSFGKELDVILRDMDRVRDVDAAKPPCVLFGNKVRHHASVSVASRHNLTSCLGGPRATTAGDERGGARPRSTAWHDVL